MTTFHRDYKHGMAMCRRCGHDLQVVKHGKEAGTIRCSNPACRFATRRYKMGPTPNEGPGVAA